MFRSAFFGVCVIAIATLVPGSARAQPVDDDEAVGAPSRQGAYGNDEWEEGRGDGRDRDGLRDAPADSAALSRGDIEDALEHGRSEKGKNQSLVIRDAGRAWSNALSALADEPTEGSGFWIEIYTPMSWVAQLSSDAAREYRDLSAQDLDRDDLARVLRVIVHPDMPDRVNRRGMRLSASVAHVVIRARGRKHARPVQPLSVRSFDETATGRRGRQATFSGVEAVFDLDAVVDAIGTSPNGEFDVVVIGERNREKTFGVKKKHFDRLPGLPRF